MPFDDVLDHMLEMLQHRGQVRNLGATTNSGYMG